MTFVLLITAVTDTRLFGIRSKDEEVTILVRMFMPNELMYAKGLHKYMLQNSGWKLMSFVVVDLFRFSIGAQ